MTFSTEGIVVRQTRYGDHGLVLNIYTRLEGMRSFMLRGGLKQGGKFRSSCFFPLSQVEISYSRGKQQTTALPFLREAKLVYPYRKMYSDIRKSSVAMFLSEAMARFITQSEQDEIFYDKISLALRHFDSAEGSSAEFHLFFLLELCDALGFYPRMENAEDYFDLREGRFESCAPLHSDFLQGEMASGLARLLRERTEHGNIPHLTIFSSSLRFSLVQALTRYCQLQSGVAGTFKSLSVLKEVFE